MRYSLKNIIRLLDNGQKHEAELRLKHMPAANKMMIRHELQLKIDTLKFILNSLA